MTTDERHDAILDKLDDLSAGHQPCARGADYLHCAVDGLRAVVVFGAEHPGMTLLEPVLLAHIAEAMGIPEVSGG